MNKAIFNDKNISGIGGRGKENSPEILRFIKNTLDKNADNLSAFMQETGFSAKNISSMLNKSGNGVALGIDALINNKDKLKEFIDEKILDPNSISGMLADSGKNLPSAIDALVTNKERLKRIIEAGPFDAKSISSMFNGIGKDLTLGLDEFEANKNKLEIIITEGPFDPKGVSNILHGTGKDWTIAVETLDLKMPKLIALSKKFGPEQIASKLNPITSKKLGLTIDKMHTDLLQELNGNTMIPAGVIIADHTPTKGTHVAI